MRRFTEVIQDEAGNIVAGAEVYVRKVSDQSLVALYSDDGSTTTANPLVSSADGYITAFTANNNLDFQVYVDGELEKTVEDIQHYDLGAISAAAWTILDDASVAAIATTLGLGTGDSPQFTAVNVGAASDTTVSRASAGDIAVEGNIVYRAGGTDVPVADGGTGSSTAAGAATNLGLGTGDSPQFTAINLGHASDTTLTRVSAGLVAIEGVNIVTTATNKPTESLIIACSDETTAITTGTAKVTFRMPYAFTLSAVRASVGTAPTGSTILIDINESGTTILSTKLMIDASEKTSTTAATPAVISDSSLADDAEITIDFDQVGSTIAGAGVKVYLIGTRT